MTAWRWPLIVSTVVRVNGTPRSIRATAASRVTRELAGEPSRWTRPTTARGGRACRRSRSPRRLRGGRPACPSIGLIAARVAGAQVWWCWRTNGTSRVTLRAPGVGVREPVGQPEEERGVRLAGELGGPLEVAAVVGGIGAARGEPASSALLHHRRELGEPVEAPPGVLVVVELGLERGELRDDRAALQAVGGLDQEVEGLAVAVEELEGLGDRLDRRAIPGAQVQRVAAGLQRGFVAILHLEERGALDLDPGPFRPGVLGSGEPGVGGVEVAEVTQRDGPRGVPVGSDGVGGLVEFADRPEQPEGVERALPADDGADIIVCRLGVGRVSLPRPKVVRDAQPRRAEVHRQAAGDDPGGRPRPALERPERRGQVVGPQAEPVLVEVEDPAEVVRADLDPVGGHQHGGVRPLRMSRCLEIVTSTPSSMGRLNPRSRSGLRHGAWDQGSRNSWRRGARKIPPDRFFRTTPVNNRRNLNQGSLAKDNIIGY